MTPISLNNALTFIARCKKKTHLKRARGGPIATRRGKWVTVPENLSIKGVGAKRPEKGGAKDAGVEGGGDTQNSGQLESSTSLMEEEDVTYLACLSTL